MWFLSLDLTCFFLVNCDFGAWNLSESLAILAMVLESLYRDRDSGNSDCIVTVYVGISQGI